MKRKIALALTMAMLGTCLAGCGQADTDTNASTEAKDACLLYTSPSPRDCS